MDKNNREKDMLYQWAGLNSVSYCFQKIDKDRESYFKQRADEADSSRYIREYAVESVSELMKEMDTLWGTDEVMCQVKKAIGVAALKNMPVESGNQKEVRAVNKAKSKDKLPVFIYNF